MTIDKFPEEVQESLPGMGEPEVKEDYLADACNELGISINKPEELVKVIQFLKQSMQPVTITLVLNPVTFEVQSYASTQFPVDSRFYRNISQAFMKIADGFSNTALEVAEKKLADIKAKEVK
jgi:hypothetical protein